MKTSSSVTTQAAVSEQHTTSVTAMMIVVTGLMNQSTAVSDVLPSSCQSMNRSNSKCYIKARLQGGPKFGTIILFALTLPNINRFSKLFHYQNQEKFVIILALKIPPHLKCVATLPCEMSSVLKATHIENKTTSVTTHFKKLTT